MSSASSICSLAAVAHAHPNIALAKYWGKLAGGANEPSVPSLSVTLAGMSTTTRVVFLDGLEADRVVLNGRDADPRTVERAGVLLDTIRRESGFKHHALVSSSNDFPTAAGLASSASGFAALALAATYAAGLERDRAWVSDLARRTSASSGRSLFGGFVELLAGRGDGAMLAARPVVPAEHLPMRVVVAVTTEREKGTASTDGMNLTGSTSPYYAAWLAAAPGIFSRVREALLARDLEALGAAAEHSALAMHASAIAAQPGVLYWIGATVDTIAAVRALRASGVGAWATIDAGPHVKVICAPSDVDRVSSSLLAVPGVLRVIVTQPGQDATVERVEIDADTALRTSMDPPAPRAQSMSRERA